MNVPKRAQLIKQFSHVVFTRLRLSVPQHPEKTWADAQLEQYFEDTRQDQVVPLKFLSALRLYEDGNYAYACHLATMRTAIQALDAALNAFCKFRQLNQEKIDEMPAKGAVAIDLKTLVPREQKSKVKAIVTLYANDEKMDEFDQMCTATNAAMVFQLGHALNQLYAQASPDSAVAQPPTSTK